MGTGTVDRGQGPRLVELAVADPPEAWTGAGFRVDDDARLLLGTVALRLTGGGSSPGAQGITGWSLSGVQVSGGALDGLPTSVVSPESHPSGLQARPHPNGVTGLDHVVVSTPDLERTIDAFGGAGLDLRRIRGIDETGTGMRQAFFRLGPTVLEVVSAAEPAGLTAERAPATWFGIAVDAADLDVTAEHLGEGLGPVRPAVQRGRRIATFRHGRLGLSVAIAAMDDRADGHGGLRDPSH